MVLVYKIGKAYNWDYNWIIIGMLIHIRIDIEIYFLMLLIIRG